MMDWTEIDLNLRHVLVAHSAVFSVLMVMVMMIKEG